MTPAIAWSLFFFATLFFIVISRRALLNPKAHGFYRFFAFECILLLFLLNHSYWFEQPYTPVHLLAWALLLSSILFVVLGMHMLKRRGGHEARRIHESNLAFENTSQLVTTGIYAYVRHPLYSSLMFLAWGIYFKQTSLTATLLVVIATLCLFATARTEEQENVEFFGSAYSDYMGKTKMLIPWLL